MRHAFIKELAAQAKTNTSVFLLVGDVGYSVVEPFADQFPDRFLNVGVAEQNMIGLAAGLASEGYHVFTYTIGNFATLRCLEQIRNDVCAHRFAVTVVCVGAGYAYGNLGYSHHAVQDIAVLRCMPGLTIWNPADASETAQCVRWLVDNPRPSYLRIGKSGEEPLYESGSRIDCLIRVMNGQEDRAIVCSGAPLRATLNMMEILQPHSRPTIYSLPLVAPIAETAIEELARYREILVVEEHVEQGGLFGALSENLPRSVSTKAAMCGLATETVVGSQDYLWERNGIIASIGEFIRRGARDI